MDNKSKEIHNQNSKCYRHETFEFDSGLFDSCIDMTYVLTMENSDRIQHFTKQLELHKPSSKVIVQYNSGFRNCSKTLKEQTAGDDLADAVRNVFIHALDNGYERVLVFEDDFFMDNYKRHDIKKIIKFINNKNPDIYHLGPLPVVVVPSFRSHRKLVFFGGAASMIYGRRYMDSYVNTYATHPVPASMVDGKFPNDLRWSSYTYRKPIAFQTWPVTENSQAWSTGNNKIIGDLIKFAKLDKTHEHYDKINRSMQMAWLIPLSLFILISIGCMIAYFRNKRKSTNLIYHR